MPAQLVHTDFTLITNDVLNEMRTEKYSSETAMYCVNAFLHLLLWCKYRKGKRKVP